VSEDRDKKKEATNPNYIKDIKLYNRSIGEIDAYLTQINTDVEQIKKDLNEAILEKDEDKIKSLTTALESYEKKYDDENSFLFGITKLRLDMARYDNNIEYIGNLLSECVKSEHDIKQATGLMTHMLNRGEVQPREEGSAPLKLSGQQGESFLLNKLRGLCRVPFYNSGFWVVIKSISLYELNAFFESVDLDEKVFGRILGGHYYHMYDFRIKQAFIDLMAAHIVDSSLKDFDKSKVFEKALTLPDYNALVAAANFMLYREGIELDMVCVHEDCRHVETVNIDLAQIRYNDHSLMTSKHIATVNEAEARSLTLNDLKEYRDTLVIEKRIFSEKNPTVVTCETPTMYKYFDIGNKMTTKLISGLHTDNIHDRRFAQHMNGLAVYIYLPWIEKIEMDIGSTFQSETDKQDMLTIIIEDLIVGNDPILAKIQKEFINKAAISYFCYPGVKCKGCGRTSEDIKSDYYPADVQTLFFYLSSRTLLKTQNGLESI